MVRAKHGSKQWPIWRISEHLKIIRVMGRGWFWKDIWPLWQWVLNTRIRQFYCILWKWELLNIFSKTTILSGFCEKPILCETVVPSGNTKVFLLKTRGNSSNVQFAFLLPNCCDQIKFRKILGKCLDMEFGHIPIQKVVNKLTLLI